MSYGYREFDDFASTSPNSSKQDNNNNTKFKVLISWAWSLNIISKYTHRY